MKLNVLFISSAAYMVLLGIGFALVPQIIGLGAVPVDASAALIAFLRIPGSAFIGIGVLNWAARNAESSKARDAIFLSNTIGFGIAAILGVVGLLNGGRQVSLVFVCIHVIFSISFLLAGRDNMSKKTI